MNLNKRARKDMVVVGSFFSALILLVVAAVAWAFLDRHAYFLPGIQRERCIQNLQQIAAAKDSLREDRGLTNGAAVTIEQLREYVEGGERNLRCPGKGTYTIHPIGQAPECSEPGHTLPRAE